MSGRAALCQDSLHCTLRLTMSAAPCSGVDRVAESATHTLFLQGVWPEVLRGSSFDHKWFAEPKFRATYRIRGTKPGARLS
jgi:hypothetical protein